MKKIFFTSMLLVILITACQKMPMDTAIESSGDEELYFPPIGSDEWNTEDPAILGWNTSAINDLNAFLDQSSTRAFLLLKDGEIVIEYYNGNTLLGLPFNSKSNWYWASAGKTLTSALVGIAQQEGYLDIQETSSKYLGVGWTSLSSDKEEEIKIINHLSMTTGLDEKAKNSDCTDPECFVFKEEVGSRWSYHNGPYTILDNVISSATGTGFDDYFESKILSPTGMDGFWRFIGDNHVFFSTARSMARYGLLILNEGKWEMKSVINESFYNEMILPSQDINKAYGYLWWLNGYQPIMLPGLQIKLNRLLTPSAPADMIAAMGKNAQYLNIVPSKGLVMVRMGENPNDELVPLNFQEDLWQHINKITD